MLVVLAGLIVLLLRWVSGFCFGVELVVLELGRGLVVFVIMRCFACGGSCLIRLMFDEVDCLWLTACCCLRLRCLNDSLFWVCVLYVCIGFF